MELFQVACWLLDPSSEERTLTNMVTAFCPEELPLLDGLGSAHTHCPRVRAATTSVLVHAVMSHVTGLLEEDGALSTDTRPKLQNSPEALTSVNTDVACFTLFRIFPQRGDAVPGVSGSAGVERRGLQRGGVRAAEARDAGQAVCARVSGLQLGGTQLLPHQRGRRGAGSSNPPVLTETFSCPHLLFPAGAIFRAPPASQR